MTLWPICPETVAGSVLLCAHRQCVLWTVTTFSSHTPNAPAGLITEDIHTSPGPYSENHRHTWGTKLCWHWFSIELCVCLSSLLKLLLRWADMHKSWTLWDFSPLIFCRVHVFLKTWQKANRWHVIEETLLLKPMLILTWGVIAHSSLRELNVSLTRTQNNVSKVLSDASSFLRKIMINFQEVILFHLRLNNLKCI